MGCINSKKAIARDSPQHVLSVSATTDKRSAVAEPPSRVQSGVLIFGTKAEQASQDRIQDGKRFKRNSSKGTGSLRISYRLVEAEQNAAGWPPWLTSVAGEAIQGWVPLKADSFEKLDKIGQGTYSSVFRAREVETGRMVALKKVHIENFHPESIRFMAREIAILRRLDHPNIMKLEGIITSRLSSSIYLVFEYMEHDLAGLVSSPDIKFSETQVKCYMRQLLSGLEHCHIHGVMHRDIKTSNILVNNEGVLKIGDFGLANTLNNKNPLTSCVVTLWYRPPELLMGSTNYGVSVDLWSVGCVFAELFLGKPLLKGRTEVEQLHKIFKLCGSPPDEFWKKSKLPLATMFKPQTHYECTLREQCKEFPVTAVNLIETLLSVDQSRRGTASSALMSEYFSTEPYACDPSILPKYPPHKEMDVRDLEEAQRKKAGGKVQDAAKPRKQRRVHKILQEPTDVNNSAQKKEEVQYISRNARKDDRKARLPKEKGGPMHRGASKPSSNAMSGTTRVMDVSHGFSVPVPVSGSNGFTWAKNRKADATSTLSDGSKSKISALDPSFAKGTYDLTKQGTDVSERKYIGNASHMDRTSNHRQQKHQLPHGTPASLNEADEYNHIDVSTDFDPSEQTDVVINTQSHRKQGDLPELSGPQIPRPNRIVESLQRNENGISRSTRKSRLGRDN
ncbi:cyclin-dependent kinase C-2 C-like [Prosopis cineraria]|uniref:cyclin-dependent kinase C-2 C-like n=1 Tax=Prosopis cineraria TaxID=364024 RepID=UPI00240EA024|nr:cyclin-dependent kinase C-2 C-like [Prosopis cineraria]